MLVKKDARNRITLPKAIIERVPHAEYYEVSLRGKEILLKPVRAEEPGPRLCGVREKMKALKLSEKDIEDAVRRVRDR